MAGKEDFITIRDRNNRIPNRYISVRDRNNRIPDRYISVRDRNIGFSVSIVAVNNELTIIVALKS